MSKWATMGQAEKILEEADKIRRETGEQLSRSATERSLSAIIARDGINCFYCGKPTQRGGQHHATREHLKAVHNGGKDILANLRVAGARCNTRVGHLSVEEKLWMREHWYSPQLSDYALFFHRKGQWKGRTKSFRVWIDDPDQPPAEEFDVHHFYKRKSQAKKKAARKLKKQRERAEYERKMGKQNE